MFFHYGYWLNFVGDLESIIMEDFGKLTVSRAEQLA